MPSVLITGTSKGIGYETALAFGRAGYKVYATMRNPSQSPELAEKAARENLAISISVMDVDSDESVSAGIAAIERDHGPIDVLVNNAGVERFGSTEVVALAEVRAVMETNYFGALRCIQAVVAQMRTRQSGWIINVTSIAGRLANPPLGAYCASKWALEALTETLACEMKPFNVRVALVEPGIIDTAMARRISVPGEESNYPHRARFSALFSASLSNPTPPSLVAGKILEVAESGTWKLRHPVGPDAEPLMEWRRQMSDEEWIDLNASDDATFFGRMGRDMGAQSH
jgi:NAD(P)-dependent dehydrogenase (short-subunit alcohol dehydrogenase family)